MVNFESVFKSCSSSPAGLKRFLLGCIGHIVPRHFPIAYKIAIIMTLIISSGMVILGLVIVNNQTHLLQKQMDSFADTVVIQLAENTKELIMSDDTLNLMIVISNLGAQGNILGAVIYANDGSIMASSGNVPDDAIYRKYHRSKEDEMDDFRLHWKSKSTEGKSIGATSYIKPIRFQRIIAGHALVTFTTAEIEKTIVEMTRAIFTATIVMILLGVFVSLHMGRRISKPINTLMDASREISKGNYQFKIKERRNDEIGSLTDELNRMADGLLEKKQVEDAFSRYVSKSFASEIMGNLDHIKLGGKRVEGSVIFADIVGFTKLSEQYPAEIITTVLNDYFSYISLACKVFKGTIDKYIGDCVMIVFGVPEKDKLHKLHAVYCAVMIKKLFEQVNVIRKNNNKLAVSFRIGINCGSMLAGNLGSTDRMQYTVVGDSVNLASRLQHTAQIDQIVISQKYYNDPGVQPNIEAEEYESIKLRGIKEKVTTYVVTNVIADQQKEMSKKIDNILRIKPAA